MCKKMDTVEQLYFENSFHKEKIICHVEWYYRYNHLASYSNNIDGIFVFGNVFEDRWESGIIIKSDAESKRI